MKYTNEFIELKDEDLEKVTGGAGADNLELAEIKARGQAQFQKKSENPNNDDFECNVKPSAGGRYVELTTNHF